MPLDDETAARFDHMMLPLAQQVAAMANGENAIDMMLDLYFSFLRRKTDFFSQGEKCEAAVKEAFERQRSIVAKSAEGKARAAAQKAAWCGSSTRSIEQLLPALPSDQHGTCVPSAPAITA